METDLAEKLRLLDRLLAARGDSAGWIIEGGVGGWKFVVYDYEHNVLGTSDTLHRALERANAGLIEKAQRVLAAAP